MEERAIIIADRDADYRRQMAEHFREAGYRVETTDSVAHVLCSILEKQIPVLLLGHDFDKKISSADLIHLLKKCNRRLHVIMVSEEMPLAQVRQIRQEGVFYHALKPAASGDTAELGLAVDCAFEKSLREAAPSFGGEAAAAGSSAAGSPQRLVKPAQVLPGLLCLVGVIAAASYFSLLAAESAEQGGSMTLWLFLGLCAMIVVSQLMPLLRMQLPVRRRGEPVEEETLPLDRE